MSRSVTATIHLDALRANFARACALAGPAKVMAVVKANAYGHGLERCARAFADAGTEAFAVASMSEARRLRAAGHRQRVLILAGPDAPGDLAEMRELRLEGVIHHVSQIEMLEAERGGGRLKVWLHLDTGMHRLGFPPERAAELHARLRGLAAVDPDITLMTHFAASEEFGNAGTAQQIRRFDGAAAGLPVVHSLSNSAGLLGWPAARGEWVRAGGMLYGLSVAEGKTGADFDLAPAMTLTTRLIAINRIARGERIGYGGIWACPEDMDVGVAAIGYGDGYPRGATAGTPVLVGGERAAVAGRVSMDLLTIDLRAAPHARVGDVVTLWGPELPAETVAAHADTISYVLTCGVTQRVRFTEAGG